MKLPKTAIIGATGFIGKFFFEEYRKVYPDCIGTSRNPVRSQMSFLDLSAIAGSSLEFKKTGHRDALILSGETGLSVCEEQKEATRKVNVEGILGLIEQLVEEGIKPIFFSSDIIFDGVNGCYDENTPPHPLNEYARQKVEVESGIKKICRNGNYLTIRLSKTFSLEKGDGTLLDEMASLLSLGRPIRAAHDQIFSLLCVLDLVEVVKILQEKEARGTINVSCPETWSRYDLAIAVANAMKSDLGQVKRISLDDLNESFKRPKNTAMKTDKLTREIGYTFAPVRDYIQKVTENWKNASYEIKRMNV